MAGKTSEQCAKDVKDAITDIEKSLNGKEMYKAKILQHAIDTMKMQQELKFLEVTGKKDLQLKDKDIQIQGKEARISKLENEIDLLKIRHKDFENQETIASQHSSKEIDNVVPPNETNKIKLSKVTNNVTNQDENSHSQPILKNEQRLEIVTTSSPTISLEALELACKLFKTDLNNLLNNGITKFFCSPDLQVTYQDWFCVIRERVTNDSPVVSGKFVLAKSKCKDPKKLYEFYSYNGDNNGDQFIDLNIFEKGWRHENTEVSILHPYSINKAIQMKQGNKLDYVHQWEINSIPNEYIGKDGYFIVFCLKK